MQKANKKIIAKKRKENKIQETAKKSRLEITA
jgi:hypothetical protein